MNPPLKRFSDNLCRLLPPLMLIMLAAGLFFPQLELYFNLSLASGWIRYLWYPLGVYLLLSRFRLDREYLKGQLCLIAPAAVAVTVLYYWHDHNFFYFHYLKYVVLLVLVSSCIRKSGPVSREFFFMVTGCGCVLLSAVMIWCLVRYGRALPPEIFFQNIGAFVPLVMGTVTLCAIFCNELSKRAKTVLTVCALVTLALTLLTTSRTAYMTELVVALCVLALCVRRRMITVRLGLEILAAVLLTMAVSVYFGSDWLQHKFSVIDSESMGFFEDYSSKTVNTSIGLRFAMWQMAFAEIFPSHPFLGMGDISPQAVADINTGFISADFLSTLNHLHNEFIDGLARGGLLFLGCLLWTLYAVIRKYRTEPVFLCLTVLLLSWSLTEVIVFHKPFMMELLVIWHLYDSTVKREPKGVRPYRR